MGVFQRGGVGGEDRTCDLFGGDAEGTARRVVRGSVGGFGAAEAEERDAGFELGEEEGGGGVGGDGNGGEDEDGLEARESSACRCSCWCFRRPRGIYELGERTREHSDEHWLGNHFDFDF